jgi:acyl dehydratase
MGHGGAEMGAIEEGFQTSHCYAISPDVYGAFLRASGDTNPLHTDHEFARRVGFPEKVMHGGILACFISHFVGVHFPGGAVVLHSVDLQFKTPCHLHDEIRIDARVAQVVSSVRAVVMDLVLTNATRQRVAAKSRVQVGLL